MGEYNYISQKKEQCKPFDPNQNTSSMSQVASQKEKRRPYTRHQELP